MELHSFARDRRGNDRVGKPVIDVDEAMGEVTDRVDQSQRGERGRLCLQARQRYRAALSGDRREIAGAGHAMARQPPGVGYFGGSRAAIERPH